MRINQEIKSSQLRVVDHEGTQLGIISREEALNLANEVKLDLVEVAPTAKPPVCKIIDYGKFRYEQTKRQKESKKAQVQIKVKEVQVKPNIDSHDLGVKVRRMRNFLEKGNKVKISCMFRGREITHADVGERVVRQVIAELEDIAMPESPLRFLGKNLIVILAPLSSNVKKKKA